jgi:protein SCO1/2
MERDACKRTAIAAVLTVALGLVAAHAATDGFEAYTLETARRLKALRAGVPIPDLPLDLIDRGRARPKELPARVLLIDFVYTRCQTYCASLGSVYAQLQRRLAPEIRAGEIRLLSISFDPERDGPDELRAYRARHSREADGWYVGRTAAAMLPDWLSAFGVVVIPDEFGGYTHNAAIHVVDSTRKLVAIHDLADVDGAARAARNLLQRKASHAATP